MSAACCVPGGQGGARVLPRRRDLAAQLRRSRTRRSARRWRCRSRLGSRWHDGEIRRQSWHMDFIYQSADRPPRDCGTGRRVPHARRRHDRLRAGVAARQRQGLARAHDLGDDFATLAAMTTTAVPKQTIPSVNMIYARGGRAAIDEAPTPTSSSSGKTLSAPTARSSAASASSAAPTSSSTTPRWPPSTTPSFASGSRRAATTPTRCI